MDWYRRKSWAPLDEEEFFKKLNNAREYNRAQYLKIQALELIDTGDSALIDVAETLLNKMLKEYPEDKFNKSSALNALGQIYKLRLDYEKSIMYYKQSLDFETIYPNVKTQSYLEYAELVIKCKKFDQYDFVENLLIPKPENSLFPIEKYEINKILAVIYIHKKETDKAKYHKLLADENAKARVSGLRYHQKLGLVEKPSGFFKNLQSKITQHFKKP